MKRFLIAGMLAAALCAPRAFAADMALKAPPVVAPSFSWTGFYIGGDVGYGWGRSTGVLNNGAFNTDAVPYAADPNGAIGGGFIGYNYQISQFVLGLEADWQAADLSGSGGGSFLVTPYTMTTKATDYGSVRGRVGWAFNRWLLFATGGWDWGRTQTVYAATGAPPFYTNVFNGNGATGGAGLEYAVTNNWLFRIEYRYTDLGTHGFELPALCGCGENGNHVTVSDLRLGVAYKF